MSSAKLADMDMLEKSENKATKQEAPPTYEESTNEAKDDLKKSNMKGLNDNLYESSDTKSKDRKRKSLQSASMQFEDILCAIGDYGRYQKRLVYLFLLPTSALLPFFCMNLIFMLSTPEHWCQHDQRLMNLSKQFNLTHQEEAILSRPFETNNEGKQVLSSCMSLDLNYSSVSEMLYYGGYNVSHFMELQNISSHQCNGGWDYDTTYYRRTVSSEWNLICADNYVPSLIYTLANTGSAVGTPIFGSLSDRIGRRLCFIITAIIALGSSILTVVVPSLVAFIVVRTISGSLLPSVYQLPYLILIELVAPEVRTKMNGFACIGWTFGLSVMPLIAYLCGDWVTFGWVSAILTVPYLLYFKFLPESPRWLISQGRYDDACAVLNKIAKVNGKDVSHLNLIEYFKTSSEKEKTYAQETYVSPLQIFRSPTIRKRFIILSMSWIADSMCYYGFHINVAHLYGNEFVNFFLLGIVELPSYLSAWYLIETRLGRRWCNSGFLLIMGLACLLPLLSPGGGLLTTIASLVGKFGCSASYMVMYQQSAELFPTPLRASGMGIASTMAAIITICTPYIIYLGTYSIELPFTIMGLIGLISGVAALFLPETLHENLPQTIQDGEMFGKDRPFFSLAKRSHPVKVELKTNEIPSL